MKQIDVVASARCVNSESIKGKTAVVIDVLRATSVMTTAFEYGVKKIIPVLSPEEAFGLKESIGVNVLLGGERNAEKIPGFDFDNSPYSYMKDEVEGKTIVMTTTNGTLAINAASTAAEIFIASFRNARAVIEVLADKEDVVLVCSGTNGKYTIEDGLCAGYLIDGLMLLTDVKLTDFAHLVHSFYQSSKSDIQKAASVGMHYKVLERKGFLCDLEYCFKTVESNIIPVCRDGLITKK